MDKDKVTKKGYQDLGDAIGMPDDEDKKYIQKLLLRYDKKNPGVIKYTRDSARKESVAFSNAYGLVKGKKSESKSVDSSMGLRYMLELPEGLHAQIEAYIPTIFREKSHFKWFKKNFKELFLPEKF